VYRFPQINLARRHVYCNATIQFGVEYVLDSIKLVHSQLVEGCIESHFYNLPEHIVFLWVASVVTAMVLRATMKEPLYGHYHNHFVGL
jgi:hypothetical protein